MSLAAIITTMNNRDDMTLQAVESALRQTVPFDEIIIISERGELNKMIQQVNYHIKHMKSDRFVWLCDDDMFESNFVETVSQYDTDIVYSSMLLWTGSPVDSVAHARDWDDSIFNDTVPFITSVCTKDMWRKAGGFDDVVFCDWDFWWKCYEQKATVTKIDAHLWKHRQHGGQNSYRIDWESSRRQVIDKHNVTV